MALHQSRQHVFTNKLLDCSVNQAATSDLDSDAATPSLLKKPSDISTSIENEQPFDFKQALSDPIKWQVFRGDLHEPTKRFDLHVVGAGSRISIQPTVSSPFHPPTFLRKIREIRHPPTRDILSGFEGVGIPGQMILVLGRPGSGCSAFLKTLANQRGEYHAVEEDDIHFPTLTVNQTLSFAVRNRTPAMRLLGQTCKEYVEDTTTRLMKAMGLYHLKDALVGNAEVHGVSGGERKRVSIAATLSSAKPKTFKQRIERTEAIQP
ncbi:hypothetical protein EV702DRAFT_1194229 [Suillus placidus]|uniref:ABC transporter domain-containing protein n=1 Tax=Suillus placidus TaxID=48579 RepID=A0A9P7A2A0_9AGAM|nr:hypothetical protein EV702DRAFT_1194229 [Suillus placidus]